MKRFLLLFIVLISLTASFHANAQSTANYSFYNSTFGALVLDRYGNPIDMSIGTTQLYGPEVDSYTATSQDLGFPFIFMGTYQTQFSVSPDGAVRLGSTVISGHTQSPSENEPYLVVTNIDNKTGPAGKVHYKVQPSSSGQLLIIEWKDILIDVSATGTTYSTYQLRLYQASGEVEMVYGQMWNSSTSSLDNSIWFASSNTENTIGQITDIIGTMSYNSGATSITTSAFTASSAMNNLNSATDGHRRLFRFSPPASYPNGPSGLNFTGVTGIGMTLNWTDNSSYETGFIILRSMDGITYNYLATVAANVTSYTAAGLTYGTTYYWKVFAVNEGHASIAVTGTQATNAPSLSGIKFIPSEYASLTAAVTAINTHGLAGNLYLALEASYTSTSETFPIAGPNATSTGACTTTIYPASSGLSITSSNTTGTFDLNGSRNVVIDGRVYLTGSSKDLVIENTSTDGSAIRFINGATSNHIQYCTITGLNENLNQGVVYFSTTNGTTGNSYNTIDHCDITACLSSFPTNCIYSSGNMDTLTHYNVSNTISNCNIYDFYNILGDDNGIYLTDGTSTWTITGNSFFQTTTRPYYADAFHTAIQIFGPGDNFNISNNYIGGSSPGCGGTAWTIPSFYANLFCGIRLNVVGTIPSSIQGNTIANFIHKTNNAISHSGGPWVGISIVSGNANIGDIAGNMIGSTAGNGSITLEAGTNGGVSSTGIFIDAPSTVTNISNNNIGSVTISPGSVAYGFTGICTADGNTITIDDNLVGSTTTSNSIYLNTGYTGTTAQQVKGIENSSSAAISITNNIIANLTNNYLPGSTNSSNLLCGINSSSGTNTITGNTIRNLTTAANATGTGDESSVIGISVSSQQPGSLVSGNMVYSLSNTHSAAATAVTGIHYGGADNGSNQVSKNFLYNLSHTSSASTMTGIYVSGGSTTYDNNMIAIGKNVGSGTIAGINDAGGSNDCFFNSIYIGGTNVSGSASTYAFNGTVTVNNREYKDNIFFNARSNGTSGTGKHYAVKYGGTGFNPEGLDADFNDFFVSGTGGVLGFYNSADVTSIEAWQAATGQDYNSFNSDPVYKNPTLSTPDLHIKQGFATVVEGGGTSFVGISEDYNGQARSGLTPTDIGADAGNFTPLGVKNPADVTVIAVSSSRTNILFTPNQSVNNVIIVWNSTGTFFRPSGTPPGTGSPFSGGTLLYRGITSPQSHMSLTPGTTYFYKLFSYNGSAYSPGVDVSTTTLVPDPPGSFQATSLFNDQVDLEWTPNSNGDNVMLAWNLTTISSDPVQGITYNPGDTLADGSTILYIGNLTEFNHESLSANTTYYYKLWAVDDVIGYSDALSDNATTLCDPIATLPWNENFDTAVIPALPDCWILESGGWCTTNDFSSMYDANAHSGTQFLRVDASLSDGFVWTPGITLTGGHTYEFSFWWAGDEYPGWTGEIYYNTMPVSAGATQLGDTLVTSGTTTTNAYIKIVRELTPIQTGSYFFAVKVNSLSTNPPYYLSFDDFDVTEQDMYFVSATTTQVNPEYIPQGAVNGQIMGIQVVTAGSAYPLNATQFMVNSNGTTNTLDITKAKLFYTGNSSTFTPFNQFGEDIDNPSGTIGFEGTQVLSPGINHFWLVYNISPTATLRNVVDAECESLVVAEVNHTPSVSAPPGNRIIRELMAGIKTVGTGGFYPDLTGSNGLFQAVNTYGLDGDLTANIVSDITEPGSYPLNEWTEFGTGDYTLTISPNAAILRTLSGSLDGPLISLSGADRVTIDGSADASGNSYLSIQNTSATSSSIIIRLFSNSTHNTIKNCRLSGNINYTYAIDAEGAGIDHLTVDSNLITKVAYGIVTFGSISEMMNSLEITDNTFGCETDADKIQYYSAAISFCNGTSISGNSILGMKGTGGPATAGIYIWQCASTSVTRNLITNIKNDGEGTNAHPAAGIRISNSNAYTGITISNNIISDIWSNGDYGTDKSPHGIYISQAADVTIQNNSINMGTASRTSTESNFSGAITIEEGVSESLVIENNLLYNAQISTTFGSKSYAIYSGVDNTAFTSINNNDYFVSGEDGVLGYFGGDKLTLSEWQTATGQDAESINADPMFTDASLHLTDPGSPAIGAAIPLTTITHDYEGHPRHATYPTIGAMEYLPTLNWIGATTDWNTETNWSPAVVPDGTFRVIIPAAPTGGNFPAVGAFTSGCYSITLQGTATFSIQSGGMLNVNSLVFPSTATITVNGILNIIDP